MADWWRIGGANAALEMMFPMGRCLYPFPCWLKLPIHFQSAWCPLYSIMPETKASQDATMQVAWDRFRGDPTVTTLAVCGLARGSEIIRTEAEAELRAALHLRRQD